MSTDKPSLSAEIPQSKYLEFCLEEVLTDKEYRESGTSTSPRWMKGMVGAIKFLPWGGFKEILRDSVEAINELSKEAIAPSAAKVDALHGTIAYLNKVHGYVQTENINEGMSGAEEQEKDGEDMDMVDYESRTGEDVLDSEAEWEGPVTNEQSIESVFSETTNCLCHLLRQLFPSKLILMTKKYISSERLRRYDADIEAPSVPEDLTPGSCLVVYGKRHTLKNFPVCNIEFKGPKLDLSALTYVKDEHFEYQQDKKTSSMLSHDLERSATSREDRVRPMRPGSLTRQAAVSARERIKEQLQVPEGYDSKRAREGKEARIRTFEIPEKDRAEEERDIYLEGYSAYVISSHFNKLFGRLDHLDERINKFSPIRRAIRPVAQAISQALLSQAGCSFLYNHQTGIAFKVIQEENDSLRVYVTGVFGCSKNPGCFAAMLSLGKYAIDTVSNANQKTLRDRMRQISKRVGDSAERASQSLLSDESSGEHYMPGNEGAGGSHGAEDSQSEAQSVRSGKNTSVGGAWLWSQQSKLRCVNVGQPKHVISRQKKSPLKEMIQPGNLSLPSATVPIVRTTTVDGKSKASGTSPSRIPTALDALANAFRTNSGIIGTGESGTVYMVDWKPRPNQKSVRASVKLWNKRSQQGLDDLRNEIEMYRALENKCPNLLGHAVPRMLLGLRYPAMGSVYDGEAVLVTEFLGSGITRDQEGVVMLKESTGKRMIEPEEKAKICEAALRSLRALHENGFIHGDVSLDNLRVEHQNEQENISMPEWVVWWTDLGKTTKASSHDCCASDLEAEECYYLFHSA